jgi:hypothetical protein
MTHRLVYSLALSLALSMITASAWAGAPEEKGDKLISGMSIVGNDEAPKSLVIVPWKSSNLGETLDVSRSLDDGRHPVDRDVFMRDLAYYEIRAGSQRAASSTTASSKKK